MGKITRVMVLGLKGVGKTAILEQLIFNNISKSNDLQPTIEDIYVANIETDRGTREHVRFYDTAGLDQSTALTQHSQTRQYASHADGYVLVYRPDRPETLDAIIALKKELDRTRDKKELAVLVLCNQFPRCSTSEGVGNKAASWCARERLRHCEVDAMDRATLLSPFVILASKLNPPQAKSTFPQLSMVRKTMGRPTTAQTPSASSTLNQD